jgi:hypothetical protein
MGHWPTLTSSLKPLSQAALAAAAPGTALEHGAANLLACLAVVDLIAVADIQPILGAKGPEGVPYEPGEGGRRKVRVKGAGVDLMGDLPHD